MRLQKSSIIYFTQLFRCLMYCCPPVYLLAGYDFKGLAHSYSLAFKFYDIFRFELKKQVSIRETHA